MLRSYPSLFPQHLVDTEYLLNKYSLSYYSSKECLLFAVTSRQTGEGQERETKGPMSGGHARGGRRRARHWPRVWDESPEFLLPGSPERTPAVGAAGKEQPFLRARSPPRPAFPGPVRRDVRGRGGWLVA